MLKTVLLITVLTVTPANPKEPVPAETVTITKELAEKLVQSSIAQQQEIAQLKMDIYQYQIALHQARTRMCA